MNEIIKLLQQLVIVLAALAEKLGTLTPQEPEQPKPEVDTTQPEPEAPAPEVVLKPQPEEPVKPQPEPEKPKPKPEESKEPVYIVGKLPYDFENWPFTDDAGRQDFKDFGTDVKYDRGAWHTDSGSKVFENPNLAYFPFPKELDFELHEVVLEDAHGMNDAGVRFHAILDDADFTHVYNVIPTFYGKGYKVDINSKVAPEHAKVRAIVMETPTTQQNPSVTPSGIEFFGRFKEWEPKKVERYKGPAENCIGAVCYPPNMGNQSGLVPDKTKMFEVVDVYRMYLDAKNLYDPETGLFTFEPCKEGGWLLDTYLEELTRQGKTVILCPQQQIAADYYPELCKQLAIRYGSNANVPDSECKVLLTDTNHWGGERSRNKIKKGLNFNIKIQLDNESNKGWKGRADIPNQKNFVGFITPFELMKASIKSYEAIKSIDSNIEVLTSGLATNRPGYFLAMEFYSEVYAGGKRGFDAVAYHDYTNEKGGQRSGAVGALPPEMTAYRANAERIQNALFQQTGRFIPAYVTETGTSIGVNPEQAVIPIGRWDKFDVQAILEMRLILESLRGGLKGKTTYQMYDDSNHIWTPGGFMNWDLTMGIADRNGVDKDGNPTDAHIRRPATDATLQMLNLLKGYVMEEAAEHGSAVYVDKFTAPGKPDIYCVLLPVYSERIEEFELALPGVKRVTKLETQFAPVGQKAGRPEVMAEVPLSVDGKVALLANMKPVFIRIDS